MFLETSAVIFIKDGAPGIDVDDGNRTRDKQHEGELHHVADLHQHDGGDEGQHSDIVVILGVLHATTLRLYPCSAIVGSHGILEAAQLEARAMEKKQGQGNSKHWSEKAVVEEHTQLPPPTAPSIPRRVGQFTKEEYC